MMEGGAELNIHISHTHKYTQIECIHFHFIFQTKLVVPTAQKKINAVQKTKRTNHIIDCSKGRGQDFDWKRRAEGRFCYERVLQSIQAQCVCVRECVHVCVCMSVGVAVADGRKMTPEFDRRETGQAITHWNTQTHKSWKSKWGFYILPRLHSVKALSVFTRTLKFFKM